MSEAPALTLAVFLSAFGPLSDNELMLPVTQKTIAIIATLPRDARMFEPLADEAFQQLLLEREDDVSFQRFVECLRLLLYHDGRTELALLRIADLTYQNASRSGDGVNALAALANYYGAGSSQLPLEELLTRLERYRGNATLAHNASECQRQLRKRLQ